MAISAGTVAAALTLDTKEFNSALQQSRSLVETFGASNLTVTAGEIVPRASSTISIGEGAKLSIAAPSGAWAGGVRLNVTGTDIEARDAFRIGTSACLSSAQLAAIRMNGHRVVQDENGYVKRRTGGMFLLFR